MEVYMFMQFRKEAGEKYHLPHGRVLDMEKKIRMNIMIAPSDKKYLEKKYGGVSQGIAVMCIKERDPSEALRDIVLPKNKTLANAYIPNYLNSKDNGMEQSLALTKKIIMKECGVQERTAINYIKQLANQGFFEVGLNRVRINVRKFLNLHTANLTKQLA